MHAKERYRGRVVTALADCEVGTYQGTAVLTNGLVGITERKLSREPRPYPGFAH